jgi:hypothetical protein
MVFFKSPFRKTEGVESLQRKKVWMRMKGVNAIRVGMSPGRGDGDRPHSRGSQAQDYRSRIEEGEGDRDRDERMTYEEH